MKYQVMCECGESSAQKTMSAAKKKAKHYIKVCYSNPKYAYIYKLVLIAKKKK